MTDNNKLAWLRAELAKAEAYHAYVVRETWETSGTALEVKSRINALRDEITREKHRLEDEAQGQLPW